MQIIWPMGCKKIKDEEELDSILENDNYIGQEKIDGVRGILQVLDDGKIIITTRGSSKDSPDIPIDISHRAPGLTKVNIKSLAGTIIDGELFNPSLTSAQLAGELNFRSEVPLSEGTMFKAFDIIMFKGKYVNQRLNIHRIEFINKLVDRIRLYIPVVSLGHSEGREDKETMLYDLLSRGLEGMVFKNKYSTYQFGTPKRAAKPTKTWYKYKKKDTVDVTILGSIPPDKFYTDPDTRTLDLSRLTKPWINGWIGSISFRFIDSEGNTHIGSCSGLTDDFKELISRVHEIKDEYIGRTMEVEYMEKTTDGNLRHPRFIRIREEIEHENG